MSVEVLLGLQWGDEGKGKLVDFISKNLDYTVRFQGGNNAGHTVIVNNEKFILNLLPSSILNERVKCIISSGVVANIDVLSKEIEELEKRGINTNNIFIDYKTHLLMPYHIEKDILLEQKRNNNNIGTTKRGIGPAYTHKYERTGLRVMDLFRSESYLKDKIKNILELEQITNYKVEDIYNLTKKYKEIIKNKVIDASLVLNESIKSKKNILFEGAQGTMLDIDHGTYPYVTSSNTISGSACIGAGISPKYIDDIIGVFKAYTTRVGEGIFPTEIISDVSDKIVKYGKEYGSTTQRKRRVGWLDLVQLKYSCTINGIDKLAITKLDVLSSLEKIKVCTSYKIDGKLYNYYPCFLNDDMNIEVIYQEFDGWMKDISKIKHYQDLPQEAKTYIEFIENFIEKKIDIISVGPERNSNIHK